MPTPEDRNGVGPTAPLLLLVVLALMCATPRPAVAAEAAAKPIRDGNLLKNPSFTSGLAAWKAGPIGNTPAARAEIDRGVFRGSDMASLRLEAATGRRVWLHQFGIARDPRVAKYRFTLWWRCRGLSPDWIMRFGVQQRKVGAYVRTLQNRHAPCGASKDWTLAMIEFEPPAAAEEFAVYVGLWFDDRRGNPPKGGGTLWIDDVAFTPVLDAQAKPANNPAAADPKLVVESLHPFGERGLFRPGQPVRLTLSLKNNTPTRAALEVKVQVTDFADAPVGHKAMKVAAEPSAKCSVAIELPAPPTRGFFCVRASIWQDGRLVARPATSFCVVEPVEPRDPFFAIDPNGLSFDLLDAFRIIGVGSVGIYQPWAVPKEALADLKAYMQKQLDTRWAPVWKSDFNIVGYVKIDPAFHPRRIREATLARRERGVFPYPDALFTELGDAVEAEATVMKGRVKLWIIQEEIDAWIHNPKAPAGSGTCELARHILMTRVAYDRLKKVDPTCTVAGFGICTDYKGDPPFKLVRRMLPELKDHVDLIALDPYCEAYELGKSRIMGPEGAKLRQVLLNTQKLQAEWGKKRDVVIAEKGLSVPYHIPPDHPLHKRFANLTARNLIVAKSATPTIYYSLFTGVSPWVGHRIRKRGVPSTDEQPVSDFGIWKATPDGKGGTAYFPRSAVAAYATVARALAHATDAVELNVRKGFHSYVFRKGQAAVAALWTTDEKPYPVRLELPVAAEHCDLMGNRRALPAGPAEVALSRSPVFLTCKAGQKPMCAAIEKMAFPLLPAVEAEAHLSDLSTLTVHLVNQTRQAVATEIELDPPKGIRLPVRARKVAVPPQGRTAVHFALAGLKPTSSQGATLAARVRAGGHVATVAADLRAVPVPRLRDGLPVDGDLSKYPQASAIVLDGIGHLFPNAGVADKGLWTGPKDLSVRCYVAWDAKHFRIAARVADDLHMQRQRGSLLWMDDCLQFAFDTRNDALSPETTGTAGYDTNDYNYGMALTAAGPQLHCWVERGRTDTGGPRPFPLAIKRVGGETVYELAIPWAALAPLAPKPGRAFGFSFIAFDSDRTEDRQAAYYMGLSPGIADGQDPSAYRTFVLAP